MNPIGTEQLRYRTWLNEQITKGATRTDVLLSHITVDGRHIDENLPLYCGLTTYEDARLYLRISCTAEGMFLGDIDLDDHDQRQRLDEEELEALFADLNGRHEGGAPCLPGMIEVTKTQRAVAA